MHLQDFALTCPQHGLPEAGADRSFAARDMMHGDVRGAVAPMTTRLREAASATLTLPPKGRALNARAVAVSTLQERAATRSPAPTLCSARWIAARPGFEQLEIAQHVGIARILFGGGEQIPTRLFAVSFE